MKILITAPRLNALAVGEAYTATMLLREVSRLADVTVLSFETRRGPPLAEQLPDCTVVTFDEPDWTRINERLSSMLKISLFVFNGYVRRWLQAHGAEYDLAHHILPRAPRYPTPLRGGKLPYVIGSLGGALPTPAAFASETQAAQWFTRLRALDGLRFRADPWLRASYSRAELVMGVAPYMREVLADVPLRRFEPFLGIGVSDLAPEISRDTPAGQLKMLHVGRAVRTKGLRDVVRALTHLKAHPGITLTSIGDGEELEICRAEAEKLGVADRVSFLGRLPREEIEAHYRAADALVYPSFRESMGAVLYEAMRWSLPVVTVRAGGPDYIIDDSCGLKVDVTTPEQMPRDLADCITKLAADPALRQKLGQGGRAKLAAEALWPLKAQRLIQIYTDTIADASRR